MSVIKVSKFEAIKEAKQKKDKKELIIIAAVGIAVVGASVVAQFGFGIPMGWYLIYHGKKIF